LVEAPLFSIITPTLNAAKFIDRLCESLITQSLRSFEFIVIDGGSTDGTVELLQKYHSVLPIKVSRQNGSGGIYAAWNQGARASVGYWILYLGADDYMADIKVLERVQNKLSSNEVSKNIKFLYGSIYINNVKNPPIKPRIEPHFLDSFRGIVRLPTSGVFISRSLFDEGVSFDEAYKICGDHDFFLRCNFLNCSKILDFPVIVFSLGGLSTSGYHEVTQYWERRRILHRFGRQRPFLFEFYYLARAYMRRSIVSGLPFSGVYEVVNRKRNGKDSQ